jgi:hypothetical protein
VLKFGVRGLAGTLWQGGVAEQRWEVLMVGSLVDTVWHGLELDLFV